MPLAIAQTQWKPSIFETNDKGRWKVDRGGNEMNRRAEVKHSREKGHAVYLVGLERNRVLLRQNQTIDSNKLCWNNCSWTVWRQQLRRSEELNNRYGIIFYQATLDLTYRWRSGKNCCNLAFTSSAIFTWPSIRFPLIQISPLILCRIPSKNFSSLETCKKHLEEFLVQKKLRSFARMEFLNYPIARDYWTKRCIYCSIKLFFNVKILFLNLIWKYEIIFFQSNNI